MKTLAVVIGNNEYHEGAKLDYAIKDAEGIRDIFSRLGFDVIYRADCDTPGCTSIIEEFGSKIDAYDATIFYFAGHGFQFDGENYLTSTGCQITHASRADCTRNAIHLSEILDILRKHSDKINIIIVDACRRNLERGTGAALAPVAAPKGTMIAFSTSPGEGAKDGGFGDHSCYTGALLQYIGRERLSVEELFKKVRKTVSHLTQGAQTPWEHTSLIDDFYFNIGQLVHSVAIPYNEDVVKDANYQGDGSAFSALIMEMGSNNWNRQNPAIEKVLAVRAATLNKDQQFILGRNLLQTSGYAWNSDRLFFDDLKAMPSQYNTSDDENHVLNGVLFEIYFNRHGEFRKNNFKGHPLKKVLALRKDPAFKKSFAFIAELLAPYRERDLFWIPQTTDEYIDVDVVVNPVTSENEWDGKVTYDVIESIYVAGQEVSDVVRKLDVGGRNGLGLQAALADFLAAPVELIKINSNRPINRVGFPPRKKEELDEWL